jgi:hypothetical protein
VISIDPFRSAILGQNQRACALCLSSAETPSRSITHHAIEPTTGEQERAA